MVPQVDAVFVSTEEVRWFGQFGSVTSMDLDSNDNIYVTVNVSSDQAFLKKFDKNGQSIWDIEFFQLGSFYIKSDVLYVCGKDTAPSDPNEDSWVNRTQFVYSTDGNLIEERSPTSNICLSTAVDSTGKTYYHHYYDSYTKDAISVYDTNSPNCQESTFSMTGCLINSVGGSYTWSLTGGTPNEDGLWSTWIPYDRVWNNKLVIDSNDFIYFGQEDYPYIYKYTTDGIFVERWLHEQVIDGVPQNLCANVKHIWIAQDGNIVVMGDDINNGDSANYCQNQNFSGFDWLITKYSPQD